jgi:hypothetical protein
MSDEHLYEELLASERAEDKNYGQQLTRKALGTFKPKPIDHAAAVRRYEKDFKPMYERRKKARSSKAYRLWLKMTGQWKGMEPEDVEMVKPTRHFECVGPTEEEIRKKIMEGKA